MATRRWRWLVATLLMAVGLGVAAYRGAILREDARQLEIVIPAGTAERIAAGETDSTPPHQIELVLGVQDVLVIRNEDSVWHEVGPVSDCTGAHADAALLAAGSHPASMHHNTGKQVEIVIRER